MKCFNHPATDAVGTCSECGKATCHSCVEDLKGALVCLGCIDRLAQAYDAKTKEQAAVVQLTKEQAQRKIVKVYVLAVIGAVVGIFIAMNEPTNRLLAAIEAPLGFGYCFPCLYLGVPKVWRWWKSWWPALGCFLMATPIGWLLGIVLLLYIPFVFGSVYGMFGGGISEFVKLRKIAKGAR